jgi:hypothetical protein
MERQTVRLVEGPLHGQIRHVHPTRARFTERIQTDVIQREYGGVTVDVPQITAVSYKRVSDDRFVFCATQTAMGSPNPDFYKEEPEMSETATPDPKPPAQPVPPVQEPEPDQEPETETETETTEKTETETTEKETEF